MGEGEKIDALLEQAIQKELAYWKKVKVDMNFMKNI